MSSSVQVVAGQDPVRSGTPQWNSLDKAVIRIQANIGIIGQVLGMVKIIAWGGSSCRSNTIVGPRISYSIVLGVSLDPSESSATICRLGLAVSRATALIRRREHEGPQATRL